MTNDSLRLLLPLRSIERFQALVSHRTLSSRDSQKSRTRQLSTLHISRVPWNSQLSIFSRRPRNSINTVLGDKRLPSVLVYILTRVLSSIINLTIGGYKNKQETKRVHFYSYHQLQALSCLIRPLFTQLGGLIFPYHPSTSLSGRTQ
jgi:hypothetical protein